jgi:hypothetical protein
MIRRRDGSAPIGAPSPMERPEEEQRSNKNGLLKERYREKR